MLTSDNFTDRAFQQKQADNDRVATAAFQTIYSNAIAKMADGETLSGQDLEHFQQAAGALGCDAQQIQADITAAKAKRAAQTIADRAGSIHAKSAYVDAMFRAAGISPIQDTPAYRENLAAMQEESAEELRMLSHAEAVLAHEPLASGTTADGLPDAVAIHEAAHVTVGIALGCRLGSVALQGRGGITTFTKGISDTIQQGAVCCAGGVAAGHFYNQPMTAHLSRQDSLNLMQLLADDRDCIRSLKRAERLASCIVVANEGTIIAIARKLEQHGRLSAADIQAELDGVDDWRHVAA